MDCESGKELARGGSVMRSSFETYQDDPILGSYTQKWTHCSRSFNEGFSSPPAMQWKVHYKLPPLFSAPPLLGLLQSILREETHMNLVIYRRSF